MKRVYIAGPITGHDDYEQKFEEAAEDLKRCGLTPVNPCAPAGRTYKWYIDRGLNLLKDCDAIYLLPGWGSSKGTRLEYTYALTVGMPIIIIEDGEWVEIDLEA